MKKTEQYEKALRETEEKRMNKFENDYTAGVAAIKSFYTSYSASDNLQSLFTLSMWLPNISAQVRMHLAYTALLSIKEEAFNKQAKVLNYDDFIKYSEGLIKILPTFDMLDDYVPEPDWGEIRYYHEKTIFRMFYGNTLDGIYEFVESYNMIHGAIDCKYRELLKRSPNDELTHVLTIQQAMIASITNNFEVNNGLEIYPGHLEVPNNEFWLSCKLYYTPLALQSVHKEFIDAYSCAFGDIPKSALEINHFLDDFHENKDLRYMFVSSDGAAFPFLPRTYPATLIYTWGDIFEEHREKILTDRFTYGEKLNAQLIRYVKRRTRKENIHEFVNVFIPADNKPTETKYSLAFADKNKLFIVYTLDPCHSSEEIQSQLDALVEVATEDMKILKQNDGSMVMRHKKGINGVTYDHAEGIDAIEPTLITLIPRINIGIGFIGVPKDLPGQVMLMEDFLGIFDELDDISEFSGFYEFLHSNSQHRSPFNTVLDIFGAYKESRGILVDGATEPTMISLGSGWGSNYRYESLKEFWSKYPENHLMLHPRSYKLSDVGVGLLRLENKNVFGVLYHVRVDKTDVYITGPFFEMEIEHGRVADMLMQTVQDSINTYKEKLSAHPLFEAFKKIHLFVFPYEMTKSGKYEHLRHMNPAEGLFMLEECYPEDDVAGIAIAFDYAKVYEQMVNAPNRSLQAHIMSEIVYRLNSFINTDNTELLSAINADAGKKPRFKINVFDKPAAFPDYEPVVRPDDHHYKAAKKLIAQLALAEGIQPGSYTVQDATNVLNRLKSQVINAINVKVSEFNFTDSIGYVITKTDALTSKYELNRLTFEAASTQEVLYSRVAKYSENHSEYVKMHKNLRYLVEKFVQLQPLGNKRFDSEALKGLLGLIDWYHVIQNGSDMIYYSLAPTGVVVDNDFRVTVEYNDDFQEREKNFGMNEAAYDLETLGNPSDRADSTRDVDEYLDELNAAFSTDLGFSLKQLTHMLEILKYYPRIEGSMTEKGYYTATKDELITAVRKAYEDIIDYTDEELDKIIDFLTIKPDELLYVVGDEKACDDLPIWEHNKRAMRFNLRPLIALGDKFLWGPYSAFRTAEIWIHNAGMTMFPYEISYKNILKVLNHERELVGKCLNLRAEAIVSRHTKHFRRGCFLHKVDKEGNHPLELGDYDVLSFVSETNTIVNVETKYIEPPFCIKDAKRLRVKIFGLPGQDRGYFEKVIRREEYLKEHGTEILKALKWPLDESKPINVVTLFVMKRNYWWTMYPPFKTDMHFLRIDMLDDMMKGLKKQST